LFSLSAVLGSNTRLYTDHCVQMSLFLGGDW
jgi:hypothetical protein